MAIKDWPAEERPRTVFLPTTLSFNRQRIQCAVIWSFILTTAHPSNFPVRWLISERCPHRWSDRWKFFMTKWMTISTHHHLRNGDVLTNYLFDVIKSMGVKKIRWYPSASFPCHEHLIKYLEDGTIHHIEGSMNGPLGRFTSRGKN